MAPGFDLTWQNMWFISSSPGLQKRLAWLSRPPNLGLMLYNIMCNHAVKLLLMQPVQPVQGNFSLVSVKGPEQKPMHVHERMKRI